MARLLHSLNRGSVSFAIGNFDGIHLGHQESCATSRVAPRSRRRSHRAYVRRPAPLKFFAPTLLRSVFQRTTSARHGFAWFGSIAVVIVYFGTFACLPRIRTFCETCLRALLVGRKTPLRPHKQRRRHRVARTTPAKTALKSSSFRPVIYHGEIVSSTVIRREIPTVMSRMLASARTAPSSSLVRSFLEKASAIASLFDLNLQPEQELLLPGRLHHADFSSTAKQSRRSVTNIACAPLSTHIPDLRNTPPRRTERVRNKTHRNQILEALREEKKFRVPEELRAPDSLSDIRRTSSFRACAFSAPYREARPWPLSLSVCHPASAECSRTDPVQDSACLFLVTRHCFCANGCFMAENTRSATLIIRLKSENQAPPRKAGGKLRTQLQFSHFRCRRVLRADQERLLAKCARPTPGEVRPLRPARRYEGLAAFVGTGSRVAAANVSAAKSTLISRRPPSRG